jgi:serine/threonine protein kinase
MAVDAARAKTLFLAASDQADPAERAAYLERECGGDAELRARVEALLRANDAAPLPVPEPKQTIGPSVPDARAELPTDDRPGKDERVGAVIAGKYKLLEEIGEGGMGTVYMAQQTEPVRRAVAVKVIKAGMDSKAVLARFEAERQALALMDHPNIAKVLDAGATDSGRPYFVMELVKGVPVTEFCDKNRMPADQRLKLFIDVCHAIQHAHHKGVIHRDIKPSNVMVTLHDGVPVVKVIDFGVAKATVQKLTERTLFTAYGQMVGTPAYMSPEQAEMSGLDIDTRSDIYSLGVLLYELLTGTTPLESKRLREAGYAEMQRLIREEEPPRPSTRLSSLGDSATVLAGNRGMDVKQLARLLAADLDWIVMKALEKDRSRRYDTPGSFAADIERYLHREPIAARPPSRTYKLKKFAQRNRASVLTAAAVAAALVLGTAVASWQAVMATQANAAALLALDEKEKARAAEASERERATANERKAFEAAAAEKQAKVTAESVLIRGWLRSLRGWFGLVEFPEIDSLMEVARFDSAPVRLSFIDVGLGSPLTAEKLCRSTEASVRAAVGLDAGRRADLRKLLLAGFWDRRAHPRVHLARAMLLVELGETDAQLLEEVPELLLERITDRREVHELRTMAASVMSDLAWTLSPKQAGSVAASILTHLDRVDETKDGNSGTLLGGVYAGLASKLERAKAIEQTWKVAMLFERKVKKGTWDAPLWANALVNLVNKPDAAKPSDAITTAASQVRDLLSGTPRGAPLETLIYAMDALAAKLPPADAARLAAQAMTKYLDGFTGDRTGIVTGYLEHFDVLFPYLEPAGAKEAAVKAKEHLAGSRGHNRDLLARMIGDLATKLDPDEAATFTAPIAAQLLKDFGEPTGIVLELKVEALSSLLTTVPRPQAAAMIEAAVTTSLDSLAQSQTGFRNYAIVALRSLTDRLDPDQAFKVATRLRERLREGKLYSDRDAAFAPEALLCALAARMNAAAAKGLQLPMPRDVAPVAVDESQYIELFPPFRYPHNITGQDHVRWLDAYRPMLTKQDLIDLLKRPSCVGRARQVVVRELAKRTGQPFAGVWDVVEWARLHEPQLDLASPPRKQPDFRKLSAEVESKSSSGTGSGER